MKTLLKVAAATLLAWAAVAPALAAPPANLTISSERGQPFSLVLDGRLLTRPIARQVHAELLAPGRHWAEFSVPMGYGQPLHFRTMLWLAPGLETDYVLVMRPYGPQLRQVAAVALGGPAYGPGGYPAQPGGNYGYGGPPQNPGGYYGNGAPAPYGNQPPAPGQYDDEPQPDAAPAYPPGNYQPNGNAGPGAYPPASPPADDNGNYPPDAAPGTGGYYPGPAGGAGSAGSYLRPLPPADVQRLTQALRERPFDDTRLPIAKQALAQGSVRAAELAALLSTLTGDKSRIELAKYGYAHVSDPQNFYQVYDVLRYPDSIREVQQALGISQ